MYVDQNILMQEISTQRVDRFTWKVVNWSQSAPDINSNFFSKTPYPDHQWKSNHATSGSIGQTMPFSYENKQTGTTVYYHSVSAVRNDSKKPDGILASSTTHFPFSLDTVSILVGREIEQCNEYIFHPA